MKLIMLETNGNQRFVFSSPRLRENVGASYLITQLAEWTEQAASSARPKIDFGWVSKSSGKVILTVATEDNARKLIGKVTRKAFSAAPGLDVSGVFVDLRNPGDDVEHPHVSDSDLKKVHRTAAEYALNRPPAQARFSQMPFLQRGRDSALSASSRLGVCDEARDDKATALSLSSRVSRYRANDARCQFMKLAKHYFLKVIEGHWSATRIKELLVRDPTKLEEKLEEKHKRELVEELLEEFEGNIDSTVPKDAKKQKTSERNGQAGHGRNRAENEHGGQNEDELIDRKDRTEDERLSKVAVIHIDGNGVGGIMRNLQESLEAIPGGVFRSEVLAEQSRSGVAEESASAGPTDDPHKSPDALRRFLLEINRRLEKAMQKSFLAAWAEVAFLAEKDVKDIAAIPVVPVILGGDDATVITDATYALPFTEKFLTAFEEETGKDALLKYLGPKSRQGTGECAKSTGEDENAEGAGENAERESKNAESASEKQGGPMTAAAGVAIVPRKFPFHIAYDLAERLIKSAKALGKVEGEECSTLNFHVLFDSTVLDPDELLRSYKSFTRRPLKVTSDVDLEAKAKKGQSAAPEGAAEDPHEHPALRGHPAWKEMCERTALFKGLKPAGGNEEPLAFPKTRAARIRKLQSDTAREEIASSAEQAQAKKQDSDKKIDAEWQAAKDSNGELSNLLDAIGGPDLVFDLIELADLLPQSYLEELERKETGQEGAADQQNDEGQEGAVGKTDKASKGNRDSTNGNGPSVASQEARK